MMWIVKQQTGSAIERSNRAGIRSIIVVLLALAMTLATVAIPAHAGETSNDDLEAVRATVLDAVNWKISSLNGMKAETSNPDKVARYSVGVSELVTLRDTRIVTEDNISELWGLKERAHAIHQETITAVNNIGSGPADELAKARDKAANTIALKIELLGEWIEGQDSDLAEDIIESGIARLNALRDELDSVTDPDGAWAIKDRAKSIYYETIEKAEAVVNAAPTEEEKAEEALAKARRTTLRIIERKAAILNAAADAAGIPAVIEIFSAAAHDIENLSGAAKSAKTIDALEEIQAHVKKIYDTARAAVGDIKGDDERDDDNDDAADEIRSYLTRSLDYVSAITDRAEWSATQSPDTWEALLGAQANVVAAADAVNDVATSGKNLDDRWTELNDAMRDFRRALIAHYVALRSEPTFVGGFHVAG